MNSAFHQCDQWASLPFPQIHSLIYSLNLAVLRSIHSFSWMSDFHLFPLLSSVLRNKTSPSMHWCERWSVQSHKQQTHSLFGWLNNCFTFWMFTHVFYSLLSCLSFYFLPVFVSSQRHHSNINPKHQTKAQLKTFTVYVCARACVCGYVTGRNSLSQPTTSTEKEWRSERGRSDQSEGFVSTPGHYGSIRCTFKVQLISIKGKHLKW